MLKTRVVIKPDTKPGIGLGHFYRCLSIVSMIKSHFECVLFDSYPSEKLANITADYCNYYEGNENFNEFLKFVKSEDIVLIDDYNFNLTQEKQLKEKHISIALIDDNFFREYVSDLIINHCPGITSEVYKAPKSKLLLGLDFAILRPSFLEDIDPTSTDKNNILICFGGDDSKNLTISALQELSLCADELSIDVIIGAGYWRETELLKTISENKHKINLHQSISEKEMAAIIKNAKLGIVACSSILIEAKAFNLPCIGIKYVDNQKDIFNYFKSNDLEGIYIDNDFESFNINHFEHAQNLKPTSKSLIDGLSDKRILNAFLELRNNQILKLRQASAEDAMTYFNWVNEPSVRENSFQSETVELEGHLNWFNKRINSLTSFLFIGEISNNPCGQIRFDVDENLAYIDISIDSKYRGQRIAPTIIKKGIQAFKKASPEKEYQIIAEIKITNEKSINAFKGVNFIETNRKTANGTETVVLTYQLT